MERAVLLPILSTAVFCACSPDSETAILRSDTGRLALRYSCTASLPPRDASDLALARAAIAHQVAEHILEAPRSGGMLRQIRAVERARVRGDSTALELAVVEYICQHGQPPRRAPRFPEPGSTPPLAELRRVVSAQDQTDDEMVRISDHKGRIVVLNFWSTWCGPCIEEMPELQRVAKRYSGEGVVVYGVVHGDDPARALEWMRERGYDFPILSDPANRVADAYRVRGIPDTYIIGRDGRLARRRQGYFPGRLEEVIQEVLQAEGAA